jgi:hypothetical protein
VNAAKLSVIVAKTIYSRNKRKTYHVGDLAGDLIAK